MLHLSFKEGESVKVGDHEIKVTKVDRGIVRLAFDFPRDVPIVRSTLLETDKVEGRHGEDRHLDSAPVG